MTAESMTAESMTAESMTAESMTAESMTAEGKGSAVLCEQETRFFSFQEVPVHGRGEPGRGQSMTRSQMGELGVRWVAHSTRGGFILYGFPVAG
jgi:hypothetical protein